MSFADELRRANEPKTIKRAITNEYVSLCVEAIKEVCSSTARQGNRKLDTFFTGAYLHDEINPRLLPYSFSSDFPEGRPSPDALFKGGKLTEKGIKFFHGDPGYGSKLYGNYGNMRFNMPSSDPEEMRTLKEKVLPELQKLGFTAVSIDLCFTPHYSALIKKNRYGDKTAIIQKDGGTYYYLHLKITW